MSKKRIAVVGLYSIPNMGDKILCEATQHLIKKIEGRVDIVEVDVSPRNSKICVSSFERFKYGVSRVMNKVASKIFAYKNKSKFRYNFEYLLWYLRLNSYFNRKLSNVDAIVFAGGGFIKFRTQGLNYYVELIVKIAKKHNIPVMFNGCGIEGYDDDDIRCNRLKAVLNEDVVKVVTTRDDVDTLQNKYITNKNTLTSRVGDPALWTPECYRIKRNENRTVVGINIIRGKIFTDYGNTLTPDQLRNFYLNLIEEIDRRGWDWVLFSNGMTSDQVEGKLLLKALGKNVNEKLLVSPKTSEKMLSYIVNFKGIFGARLHADITSYSLDVPVVAFDWSEKTLIFSQIIGKPNNFFNEKKLNVKKIVDAMERSFTEEYDVEIRDQLKNLTVEYLTKFLSMVKVNENRAEEITPSKKITLKGCYWLVRRKIKQVNLINYSKKIANNSRVKDNKIVFLTFQGEYTCNPKGIAQEILKQDLPYDIVWAILPKNNFAPFPTSFRFVKVGSKEFYKEIATAKIVIDNTNTLQRRGVTKNPEQVWIQTWHGSLGIKRLDGDIVKNNQWEEIRINCEKNTDYLISNSDFETEVFNTSYWKGVPVLEYGHARNDILFKDENSDEYIKAHEKICNRYGINKNQKLFIYAPTHGDGKEMPLAEFNFSGLKQSLEEKFGGEWIILIRLHARLKRKNIDNEITSDMYGKVINVSDYPDMQELLLVCESGVTDYSSWIFDFVLRRKPAFLLTEEVDDYEKDRGFYYDLRETPFPIASTVEGLLEKIKSFDESTYDAKIDKFLAKRGCYEDGNASKRIVDKLNEISGVTPKYK